MKKRKGLNSKNNPIGQCGHTIGAALLASQFINLVPDCKFLVNGVRSKAVRVSLGKWPEAAIA